MACEEFARLFSRCWKNQAGSKMCLCVNPNGNIEGEYFSALGNADGAYSVVGRMTCGDRAPILAMAVSWMNDKRNSNSATVWTGHYIPDTNSMELTWLMSHAPEDINDRWKCVSVNKVQFTPDDTQSN